MYDFVVSSHFSVFSQFSGAWWLLSDVGCVAQLVGLGGWLPGQLCAPLLCPRRRAHHPLRMLHRSLKYIYNDKDKDKDKDRDNYKYTNTSTKTRANSNRSTIFFSIYLRSSRCCLLTLSAATSTSVSFKEANLSACCHQMSSAVILPLTVFSHYMHFTHPCAIY